MSRCFPFPPPGYVNEKKNRVSEDSAISESIKRERDRAEKERRKEKKREKKEKKERKKKEKKEKLENKEEVEKKTQSHKDEGTSEPLKFIDHQKRKEHEIEQLEKSSLTEEHGQPNGVPKVCDSSDSTQNSGKRKRHNTPTVSQTQSTMLRIRLPVGNHRDPEGQPSKEQLCSSARGTKHRDPENLLSTDQLCSSSRGAMQKDQESLLRKGQLQLSSSSRGDKRRDLNDQLTREQPSASAPGTNHKVRKELLSTGQPSFLSSGTKLRDAKLEQPSSSAPVTNHKVRKEMLSTGQPSLLSSGTKLRDAELEQPCSSSRGTKRRCPDEPLSRDQLCSPPNGTKCRDLGELPSKVHIHSSSKRTSIPAHNIADPCPGTSTAAHKMAGGAPSPSIRQSCSSIGKTEVPAQDISGPAAAAKLGLPGSGPLTDVQLRNLLENWVPPPIQAELTDSDDQDWLFDMPSKLGHKRTKVMDVTPCNAKTSLWPRAHYLPEAELYVLPYTVPF